MLEDRTLLTTFVQVDQLVSDDGFPSESDEFGASVAVDGDFAVVGAPGDGELAGAAFVFRRDDNGTPDFEADDHWQQVAKLAASTGDTSGDSFGASVAISGDTIVVGAPFGDASEQLSDTGGAYVFVRDDKGTVNLSDDEWIQQALLAADDPALLDEFGSSVAIDGDTIVVGAPKDDTRPQDTGSAYVFNRTDGIWSQGQQLVADDASLFDDFGRAVSISADSIVIGAPAADTANGANAGAAYVFTATAGVWSQQQKLEASDAQASNEFGWSVGITGDFVVVGAPAAEAGYTYMRADEEWTEQTKLTADDGEAGDEFGSSVAIDGATVAIGAPSDDFNPTDAGSVYTFEFNEANWAQTDKLTASNAADGERFGFSIALHGSTIVVGAPATGLVIGSFQSDDLEAAYVFGPTPATIEGIKFNDLNGNGVQDEGDPGLDGVLIAVLDEQGNIVDSQLSGGIQDLGPGGFRFDDLAPGQYTVIELLTPDDLQTFPALGIPLADSHAGPGFDWVAETTPGTIEVYAYATADIVLPDDSLEGIIPTSILLAGQITLQYNAPDASGNVNVAIVSMELVGSGVTLTSLPGAFGTIVPNPADPTLAVDTLSVPFHLDTRFSIDIPQLGEFDVDIFMTADSFGPLIISATIEQSPDFGVAYQQDSSVLVVIDTITANGMPLFGPDGLLDSGFEEPPELAAVLENVAFQYAIRGPVEQTVLLGSGELASLTFGNVQASTIEGTKFHDFDGDGVQDEGEPGLAGWTIQLFDDQGQLVTEVVTAGDDPTTPDIDETGRYNFGNLLPGVYLIREVLQDGWEQTLPGEGEAAESDFTHVVVLTSGTNETGVHFGNRLRDFGDAPAVFGTLDTDNGAWHIVDESFFIGPGIDGETDGQPSAAADGDNTDGFNDERGISIPVALVPGGEAQAVAGTIDAPAGGLLDAWIDWDGSNTFDPDEHLFGGSSLVLEVGTTIFAFTVPTFASIGEFAGNTYARFRLSETGGLAPTGPGGRGEVQDHLVTILDPASLEGQQAAALNEVVATAYDLFAQIILDPAKSVEGVGEFAPADSTTVEMNDTIAQLIAEHGDLFGDQFLVIWADPVDFVVTDADGRSTGFTQQGGFVNDFGPGGAVHSGDGPFELLVIPNASAGNYTVELSGLGAFRGGVNFFSPTGVASEVFQGSLLTGSNLSLVVDPGSLGAGGAADGAIPVFSSITDLPSGSGGSNLTLAGGDDNALAFAGSDAAALALQLGLDAENISELENPLDRLQQWFATIEDYGRDFVDAVRESIEPPAADWLATFFDDVDDEDQNALLDMFWLALSRNLLGIPGSFYNFGAFLSDLMPEFGQPTAEVTTTDSGHDNEAQPDEENGQVENNTDVPSEQTPTGKQSKSSDAAEQPQPPGAAEQNAPSVDANGQQLVPQVPPVPSGTTL